MNLRRFSAFLVVALFFSIFFANSVCLDIPSSVKITSGIYNLGQKDITETFYIHSSLSSYPLKVEYYFDSIDADCFASNDDVEMRLFPTGIFVSADSIITDANSTIVTFNFDMSTLAPSSFISNLIVKNKNNAIGTETLLSFKTDDASPIFTTFAYQPSDVLIPANTTIRIDYVISETGVGLENLIVTGATTQIINFDANSSYTGFIEEQLTSSRTYLLSVKDLLGNTRVENVSFVVDSSAPQISNLEVASYSTDVDGKRKVSFSVLVEDDSFAITSDIPLVYGNFSAINSLASNLLASCSKLVSSNTTYECFWNNIEINLITQTTTVPISVKTQDKVGNLATQTFNIEVFYDSLGPNIREFYLENSIGQKNIFSATDDNSTIYLEFSDESMVDVGDISIQADFDGIDFFIVPKCNLILGNVATCIWELGNSLSKYSGVESGNVTFKITLTDRYNNKASQDLVLTYNNKKPFIASMELFEKDYSSQGAIKDGIISSGEEINYRLIIIDENLEINNDLIYADFSQIDFRDGMDKKPGACSLYNETAVQCDFNNIVAENGYMKRNITYTIVDIAGNVLVKSYEVEVFALGDEVYSSFSISNITITNPLNRNIITQSGATAWFEGIINVHDEKEVFIVNYQLKSCNDSDMNPILLSDRNLYPEEIVYPVDGEDSASKNFVLKVDMKTHPNLEDLNVKTMICTMSILKRDNETLFPAEEVDFNVKFAFYDLPHDTLLKANAQKILDTIDEAEVLGSWFDSVYNIYKIFNAACTVINTGGGLLNTISGIIGMIQATPPVMIVDAETGGVATGAASMGTETSKFAAFSFLSKPPISTMCDFITCKNGGLLGDFWKGSEMGGKFTEILNAPGGLMSNICIADVDANN